jgi:hypothetical protein
MSRIDSAMSAPRPEDIADVFAHNLAEADHVGREDGRSFGQSRET